jgi:histidinol dehydrogenase
MRVHKYSSPSFWSALERFCSSGHTDVDVAVRDAVAAILTDVARDGDRAIGLHVARLDGAKLTPPQFRVPEQELAAAAQRLPAADRAAIVEAIKCVRAFNSRGLPKTWRARNPHGATIGENFHPLRRVGLYIPRGLASTVVMTSVLARVARVPEIAIFTPCDAEGRVSDAVLAAAHLCDVTEVYRIGGVPAVGAMAYGTKTIPPVVKVFGPGNAYLVEAKRQVYGRIGVDLLPGPSEVMVIADDSADPEFVAVDLLAQAEHGSGRELVYLVGMSPDLITAVHERLRAEVRRLGRDAPASRVLANGFFTAEVPDLEAAARVADWVAPEHLEIEVEPKARAALLEQVTTAGAAMLGRWSATALGDFTAGPSHELPTGRAGRFSSGLRVADFLRRTSVVEYDEKSLQRAAPVVEAFARMEKLEAHGRSVAVRAAKSG